MIGGLVSKKKEKVDIRHREGTKNGGAHVGAQFGGLTGVTEWERIGKEPWRKAGKMGFTMEKHGGWCCQDQRLHRNQLPPCLKSAVSDIQLGEYGVT